MTEVILLEKLRGYGNTGDVVNVKGGFARNYLLPRGKALRGTKENKHTFEEMRAEIEEKNRLQFLAATELASRAEGVVLVIERQASDDGKLYGSVTRKDIASEVSCVCDAVCDADVIHLQDKLKEIGQYPVRLIFHPDVMVDASVNIIRASHK